MPAWIAGDDVALDAHPVPIESAECHSAKRSERGALPEHALVALQWHAQGQTGLRMLLGTPVHRGQAYTPA